MAWVESAPGESAGANTLASHSLNRQALRAHLQLYRTVVHGESGLTRSEREAVAVAVAVSAANDRHY